jgi:methyltransferase
MPPAIAIALVTLIAVLLVMGGEALLSRVNETTLRKLGAIEPSDDVYQVMQWAYPCSFLAMAVEGAWSGPANATALLAGLGVLGAAKALKLWAITSLGVRWSFRVLVLTDRPLVVSGPYRFIRHPNYVAVVGELVGFALIVWAPIAGLLAVAGFGALMRRRIAIEDRALGRE